MFIGGEGLAKALLKVIWPLSFNNAILKLSVPNDALNKNK